MSTFGNEDYHKYNGRCSVYPRDIMTHSRGMDNMRTLSTSGVYMSKSGVFSTLEGFHECSEDSSIHWRDI